MSLIVVFGSTGSLGTLPTESIRARLAPSIFPHFVCDHNGSFGTLATTQFSLFVTDQRKWAQLVIRSVCHFMSLLSIHTKARKSVLLTNVENQTGVWVKQACYERSEISPPINNLLSLLSPASNVFEISKPPRGLNRGFTVRLWFHLPRQRIFLHVMMKSYAAYRWYFCLTETVELRFQNKRECLRSDNTAEERTVACVVGVWKGREREKRETQNARDPPRVSLAPKTRFPKTPFPFSFKRLPRS